MYDPTGNWDITVYQLVHLSIDLKSSINKSQGIFYLTIAEYEASSIRVAYPHVIVTGGQDNVST